MTENEVLEVIKLKEKLDKARDTRDYIKEAIKDCQQVEYAYNGSTYDIGIQITINNNSRTIRVTPSFIVNALKQELQETKDLIGKITTEMTNM